MLTFAMLIFKGVIKASLQQIPRRNPGFAHPARRSRPTGGNGTGLWEAFTSTLKSTDRPSKGEPDGRTVCRLTVSGPPGSLRKYNTRFPRLCKAGRFLANTWYTSMTPPIVSYTRLRCRHVTILKILDTISLSFPIERTTHRVLSGLQLFNRTRRENEWGTLFFRLSED